MPLPSFSNSLGIWMSYLNRSWNHRAIATAVWFEVSALAQTHQAADLSDHVLLSRTWKRNNISTAIAQNDGVHLSTYLFTVINRWSTATLAVLPLASSHNQNTVLIDGTLMNQVQTTVPVLPLLPPPSLLYCSTAAVAAVAGRPPLQCPPRARLL